tara:strand:+ start:1535 stop:2065 length:531 start_codon:yes stop_codon:yes gene_type:complete
MNVPSLVTERLLLIPSGLEFLSENYLSWMKDDQVVEFMESGGKNYTIAMLKDYLENIEKNNIFSWAIVLKKNRHHIGNLKIDPISMKNLYGEYGIMIGDKSMWGKGYAKEASIEVIKFCFSTLSLRKINLGVVSNNVKAIKLYESMGFIEEDRIKNHILFNTKYSDMVRMSLSNAK